MEAKKDSEILKKELEASANIFKQKFEDDVQSSVEEIKRIGTITIAVGSIFMLGYSLFRFLDKEDPQQVEDPETVRNVYQADKPDYLHAIIGAGIEMASIFILTYAKNKLKDYINGLDSIQTTANDTAE